MTLKKCFLDMRSKSSYRFNHSSVNSIYFSECCVLQNTKEEETERKEGQVLRAIVGYSGQVALVTLQSTTTVDSALRIILNDYPLPHSEVVHFPSKILVQLFFVIR